MVISELAKMETRSMITVTTKRRLMGTRKVALTGFERLSQQLKRRRVKSNSFFSFFFSEILSLTF